MKTTRRRFLGSLTSVLALAALGRAQALGVDTDTRRLIYKLNVLVADSEAAAAIGAEYLKLAPEESDAEKLADLVCGSSPEVRARIEQATPGLRRELLAERLRMDFEKDDTVSIAGWVLARTDARRCALFAVTRSAAP